MPRLLTALLMSMVLLLTGCKGALPDGIRIAGTGPGRDAETCLNALEGALEQIDQNREKVLERREEVADLQRQGILPDKIKTLQLEISRYKDNGMGDNLSYIDNDVYGQCDRSQFDPILLQQVEEARVFIGGGETGLTAEDLPDLRVTQITAEFVPYEEYENGSCKGPFMDVTISVTNQGADFPREIDRERLEEVKTSSDLIEMGYFSIQGEFDFGVDTETEGILVTRQDFGGSVMKSGETFKHKFRIPVMDNTKSLTVIGDVKAGHSFLKAGEEGEDRSRSDTFEIPIWDIYVQSTTTLRSTSDNGKPTAQTKVELVNLGEAPTPGPIYGSFTVYNEEGGPSVMGRNKTTFGPLDSSDSLLGPEKELDTELSQTPIVKASLLLLCPNGKTGQLSDGDGTNNSRELKTQ